MESSSSGTARPADLVSASELLLVVSISVLGAAVPILSRGADFGLTQITEILQDARVELVGPLPGRFSFTLTIRLV